MNAASDVLGEEGRKVLDACVKVKIKGERLRKPGATLKYTWNDAVERLRSCYAGENPGGVDHTCHTWLNINDLLLPHEYDENGREKTYNIVDIHNALEIFDEKPFVEKYPIPGTGRDELKKLIDSRRADVEKEHAEAMADSGSRRVYSRGVAQRRVRDCYYGNFAGDYKSVLFPRSEREPNELYNIFDIRKAVDDNKQSSRALSQELRNIPSGPGSEELRKSVDKNISDLREEYEEAYTKIERYSKDEAVKRVNDCIVGLPFLYDQDNSPLSPKNAGSYVTYDIFYIYNEVQFLKKTYPTVQFKKGMREILTKKHKTILKKYSRSEAERRVRDCFPGSFELCDTDIFPHKFVQKKRMVDAKTEKTYDISDIKRSIEYFDKRKLLDKDLPETKKYPGAKERNEKVNEDREEIRKEYQHAREKVEIENGSGFIINDHYVITNKHVIIDDADQNEIFISNASIGSGELSCEVAYTDDSAKDLALLYCQGLDIKQNQIVPLHLSNEPLLPGMQVFSFGYPISHTGETALFVNGHVSGFKELFGANRPSLVVLNLSLNSGNSGGPILRWIGNQLKVVGVARQKHIKDIVTLEEMETIEQIRKSMETNDITDLSAEEITRLSHPNLSPIKRKQSATSRPDPRQIPMNLLTLKLYDALKTHSQFNLSDAVSGDDVIKFIEKALKECEGKHKAELDEVVKTGHAADHNILPSDQHSASCCGIQ